MSDTDMVEAVAVEQAVMVCPQCEGEGGYADGLDEAACHTECTRCGGNGWIVDRAAISVIEGREGWQPIETAPKATDEFGIGPWLLLFVPEGLYAPNMVTIGAYFREEHRDDQGRFLGGKWTAVDADMIRSAYIKPTHWRPLPAPPSGDEG